MLLDEWALPFSIHLHIVKLTHFDLEAHCIFAKIDLTVMIKFTNVPNSKEVMDYVEENGEC